MEKSMTATIRSGSRKQSTRFGLRSNKVYSMSAIGVPQPEQAQDAVSTAIEGLDRHQASLNAVAARFDKKETADTRHCDVLASAGTCLGAVLDHVSN